MRLIPIGVTALILSFTHATFAQQPEMATAIAFTEGPAVDADGNVYFTDMVWQKILKLTPGGVLSTFREQSNNANGLLIDPQGRLIACEGADSPRRGTVARFRPQVTRTDLRTGAIEVLAILSRGSRLWRRTTSRSTAAAGCMSPISLARPSTASTAPGR